MNKDKSNAFENFSDWLKQENQHHIATKGISKVIKQDQITVDENNTASAQSSPDRNSKSLKHKPQISLEEKDGIVTGIKITCVCGELIHVHFDYDSETNETYLHKS